VNLRESSAILENKSYVLLNWSKDGGLIQGYNGSLLIGDKTSITLEIGSSRGTMNIHGTTRIEWRDEDNVGLSWTIPVDRNLDVLQLMIEITLDSEPW
jgi:hypothetical protein